ncbi:methyltransferase family protein [Amylibacter marinus]|nr:isoprenylcysteine carboxylmethyltransferase family protein [Amylibacter marinus]
MTLKHFNIPPFWTIFASFCAVVLHLLYPVVLLDMPLLAYGLITLSLVLLIWPGIWFRRYKTTIVPRQKPSTLMVGGPFTISRNPMYLGMVLLVLGTGVLLGSVQALLPAVWLFFFLGKNYITPEERKLREAFDREAEDYFARTGRWVWFL